MSEQKTLSRIPCPPGVLTLVEKFHEHVDAYKSGKYNETQVRREFVDPLFEALGWDITNKAGLAEAYKDVIHEDAVKIGGATKAPDYSFRVGGTRKFFLETKKPSVYIKEEVPPAYQLRRYAWSAKLPLSILSDFEEFAVYDTRIEPKVGDKASLARVQYFTYKDYVEKWHEIASIFSKDAVLKGSFDKYAETSRLKKGTATVDDAFLAEIEDWRELLARNIALRNSDLTQRELNFCVQRTIDRIVFLRICEDRGIEEYGRLQALLNGANAYKRLVQLFEQADDRYNSGLFHFQREKDRHEEPDKLTLAIEIDDKPLKDIVKRLYYPDSPYEFSVISADILGQVYEQFLGKVIRLTAGHQAKVEEKPEVRKAGGVYYTPKYIVDYIVKNTVGVLLNGSSSSVIPAKAGIQTKPLDPRLHGDDDQRKKMTPKEASKLRILDPACGSGSFLLGAYQFLLDWHRDWYVNDDKAKWSTGKNPTIYQAKGDDWHLTTAEKKRILLNNIYGVDIDSQAVEVTKLSLLLKVLEGENNQTLANQLRMFHERALPDLGDNIKCGNSLIGPDFYDNDLFGQRQSLTSSRGKDHLPISPLGKGGLKGGRDSNETEERLRINAFDWENEFPEIMKAGGFDAVIGNPPYGAEFPETSNAYFKNKYSTFVLRGESYLVFIERAITLLRKEGQFGYIVPDTYLNLGFTQSLREYLLHNTLLREIVSLPSKVFVGATVDTTLLFAEKTDYSQKTHHEHEVSIQVFNKKKSISSISQPDRVFCASTGIWQTQKAFNVNSDPVEAALINRIDCACSKMVSVAEMFSGIKVYEVGKGEPPQTAQIRETKPYTSASRVSKAFEPFFDGKHIGRYSLLWNHNNWLKYGPWLAAPRDPANFVDEKILVRKIVGETLIATYIPETSYCNTLLHVLKIKPNAEMRYQYLLAIMQFPLPNTDKSRHDKMVSLVDQMLSLNKQLPAAKTGHETTALQRRIDTVDRQIDQLVYELYGLTAEEIGIVEGK